MSLLHWAVVSWLSLILHLEYGFLLLRLECDALYLSVPFKLFFTFQNPDFPNSLKFSLLSL